MHASQAVRGQADIPSERRGWTLFACLPIISALLLAGHAGHLVQIGFTPLAAIIGLYLLIRFPRIYVAYVLMVISISPLVRRIADFEAGFVQQTFVLVAPFLVTALAIFRLRGMKLLEPRSLFFLLPLTGVFYGAAVGCVTVGVRGVILQLAAWLSPIFFGMYCLLHEDAEHSLASVFTNTLVILGAIVGVYGVLQYISPFAWDMDWLTNMQEIGLATSMGTPEPFGIRVFSTLNSPQVAAGFLGPAFLVSTRMRSRWKVLFAAAMLTAILLTLVRSVYLACLLGGCLLLARASAKARIQVIVAIGVAALALTAASDTVMGSSIQARLTSLQSVQTDNSYRDRQLGMREALKLVAVKPFGTGIGYIESQPTGVHFAPADIGILSGPLDLGYLGFSLYLGTIVAIAGSVLWKGLREKDEGAMSLAIAAVFVLFLFGDENPLATYMGILFWAPASLLLRRFTEAEAPKAVLLQQSA